MSYPAVSKCVAKPVLEPRQHGLHFAGREHDRQALRRLCLGNILQPVELLLKDFAIQEQQRTLGLILGRCGDPAPYGEVGKESLYLLNPHIGRVTLAVKANKAFNPINITVLSADAVVLDSQTITNLIKKLRRRHGESPVISGCRRDRRTLEISTLEMPFGNAHFSDANPCADSDVYF